ncbi:hypothetical protein AcW1_006073 [Taiwanofungus camphoratus]|nr:hypothetical protein AcV7_008674 [Antrodia cinnamomea]KAI0957796.1 hypothetical protein AcW1_006073 [Antrodia cinnamomea]
MGTSGQPDAGIGEAHHDGNLAFIYTLIYSFLVKRSHTKAAEVVKKAARDIVVLKSDASLLDTSLDEVVKQWKALTEKPAGPSNEDSSDSDSDSDSSSEASNSKASSSSSSSSKSSDSDSESSEDKLTSKVKTLKSVPVKVKKPSAATKPLKSLSPQSSKTLSTDAEDSDSDDDDETSSDSSSSSSGSGVESGVKKGQKVPNGKGKKGENSNEESSSGNDDNSSEDESEEAGIQKLVKQGIKAGSDKAKESSSNSSTSSDSDSDDSSSSSDNSDSDSDSSDSNSSSENSAGKVKASEAKASLLAKSRPTVKEDDVRVVKKRRVSDSGAAVPSATVSTTRDSERVEGSKESAGADAKSSEDVDGKNGNGKGKPRKSNTPFQRVKPEQVRFYDERLKDNRFESRGAGANDYGERAARDLIVTHGAGFRKEKNKKKRGSYRGGDITVSTFVYG